MIRLTRSQVREIDRRSVEEFHIPGVVLMENAARAAADVALEMLGQNRGPVLIFCGGGNNGGDGLAIARHLHNHEVEVRIVLTTDPAKYQNEALANWRIVQAMKLPVTQMSINAGAASQAAFSPSPCTQGEGRGEGSSKWPNVAAHSKGDPHPIPLPEYMERGLERTLHVAAGSSNSSSLIIDAIFGTGLSQTPRDPFPQIARDINSSGVPILAIDIPSGLDCDSGQPLGACIAATKTITFVAEKIGFGNPAAAKYLGQVTVGNIGCPRELVQSMNIASP
jgi:NAD(P)H-hydrate epimerase